VTGEAMPASPGTAPALWECDVVLAGGFAGPVYPVNPGAEHVASERRTPPCSTCRARSTWRSSPSPPPP
jgi:hypothetical protein